MGQVLLFLVVALTVAAVVFGVAVLVTGRDPGLDPAEPDGRAVPLPGSRPLAESDVIEVRFDTALRGYRMAQVDLAMRRAAYDIGYKDELIGVLEAEVAALREGRIADADELRRAREAALAPPGSVTPVDQGTVPPEAGQGTATATTVGHRESSGPVGDVPAPDDDAPGGEEPVDDVPAGDAQGDVPAPGDEVSGGEEPPAGDADRTEPAARSRSERP